ncbi:MAG: aspartyl protease family protein [Bacteroidaceae bacterium]|nr:aspartyl protease family protein [Bacteroidaceae bacterium]
MKRIKSLSDKRLIIEAEVNGKKANLLVDTGAAVGIYDDNQKKKYGLEYGRRYSGTLVGAGGELKDVRVCNTFADFENVKIPQFLLADISNVVKAIKKETGIEILGIISLPQMKIAGIGIDANDMEIIIE